MAAGDSAGHLSIHVEGLHPEDVSFLLERQPKRVGLSLLASAVFDVLVVVLLMVASRYAPARSADTSPERSQARIVWLAEPGSGGGGGGGGNQQAAPPRQAELPGADALTVPAARPVVVDPPPKVSDDPPPVIDPLMLPAETLASTEYTRPGIIDPGPSSLSQGPGADGGAGTGTGGGVGPGDGRGLGAGLDRGTGGDVYRPGSGVTPPVELYVPRPRYTADAMCCSGSTRRSGSTCPSRCETGTRRSDLERCEGWRRMAGFAVSRSTPIPS